MQVLVIFIILFLSSVKLKNIAFCPDGNCETNNNGLEQAPPIPDGGQIGQNFDDAQQNIDLTRSSIETGVQDPTNYSDTNSISNDVLNNANPSSQDVYVNFSSVVNTDMFRYNDTSKFRGNCNKQNCNSDEQNDVEDKNNQPKIEPTVKATDFEIKAMLSKCSKPKPSDCEDDFECNKDPRLNKIRTKEQRTKCQEEADEELFQNCDKKISLTLKVKNTGRTNCKPQYVILDHVFDPVTEQKQKLLNIYVLKITQIPVFQTYDLVFENVVNSQASEKVLNKNDEGYTGCSTDASNPTCASSNPNIPYSTGFCCSCQNGNSGLNLQNSNSFAALVKRHIQKRGGQDCDDKYTPPNLDDSFHQSTHCLEFSDLWYSIYKISNPNIQHSLQIEIFEKIELANGKVSWNSVTSYGPMSLGTAETRYASADGNLLAYYTTNEESNEIDFSLDCKTHKLLIPEVSGKEADKNQYPEIQGGQQEYLVVKENDIDLSGTSCNKAGVGYEAFAKQRKRCAKEKSSCLKNQPSDFWKHDHDLEQNGQKGCYFLKYFGFLPDNPVNNKKCNTTDTSSQNKDLKMYFTHCYTSMININFAADLNAVLMPNALAIIPEVYTETLNPKKITITVKIFNSGLVTSIFNIALSGCPMSVPASFSTITSQPVLISPQQQHIFTLEIQYGLPKKKFFCSLEVFNQKQELIALRRIRFQNNDRCVCVWYCRCTCLTYDGLKCKPLEIRHFHAAGFQGGMAIPTQVVHYSPFDDTLSIMLHIILFGCLTLLYMGIMKALIGCCLIHPIGLWGLDKILDLPKKMNKYYENELKDHKVIYDKEGWPIHPETKKRVNNIAPPTQFSINLVFFFIFPLAIIWNLFKKFLAAKKPNPDYADLDICQCKVSQIDLLNKRSFQRTSKGNNQLIKNSDTGSKKCGLFRKKK